MNDFSFLGGKEVFVTFSGAVGGAVRWLTLRENFRDGCTSLVVGAVCATYLNPLAIPALEPLLGIIKMTLTEQIGFSAFVLGIGGTVVSGFIIDVWRGWQRKAKIDTYKVGAKKDARKD